MELLLGYPSLDGSEDPFETEPLAMKRVLLSPLVGPILSFLTSLFPIVAQEDKTCQRRLVSFKDLLLLAAHG